MKMSRCADAKAEMSATEMAALIKAVPPGPWPGGWSGWDCTRDAMIGLLDEAVREIPPYTKGYCEGRGVVISVNAKPGRSSGKHLPQGYFPGAWCAVQELRRHGCELPITFAHMGLLEWDDRLTELVAPLGVTVMDLHRIENNDPVLKRRPRILAGWESKCYSVVHAPYKEVLYLDADNFPLRDPSFLFDSQQYRYHGAVFWPDVPPYDREEWLPECVWKNIGLEYRDEVDFESGQFLINKEKCWRELMITQWINEHSDYFYKFVFGDKSTFHLAWAKLGSNWAIPLRGPGGNPASLVQHGFSGAELFQHNTRNKPDINGFPSPGSLRNRIECLGHLAELRKVWDGKIWYQGESDSNHPFAQRAVGKTYTYRRIGLDERPMRLLEDDRVGRGLGRLEVSWRVYTQAGKTLLVLFDIDNAPTAVLEYAEDGNWRGRWLDHERCEVELIRG
jgi:hypothetical protein